MEHVNHHELDYRIIDLAIFDLWKSIGDLCVYQRSLSSDDALQIKQSIRALKALIRHQKATHMMLKLNPLF